MLRNHKACEQCENTYDALEATCPNCGMRNLDFDNLQLSRKAINLPIKKQIALFLLGFLGFQLIGIVLELAAIFIFGISSETILADDGAILTFLSYTILFVIFVILIYPQYKKIGNAFSGLNIYLIGLIGCIALYAFSIVYSNIINLFYETEGNANQSSVVTITANYPFFAIIIFGVIGPLCEELTYRVGLFHLLRRWNRVGAYIITILVFALIHFDFTSLAYGITSDAFINEIINLPDYIFAGLALTFIYDKYGFGASSFAHALNNIISVLMILFLLTV